jgi:hypothetical protein
MCLRTNAIPNMIKILYLKVKMFFNVKKLKKIKDFNNSIFEVATAIINFYVPLFVLISINTKIYLVIQSRYRNPIMKYSSAAGFSRKNPKNSSTNNYLSDMHTNSPTDSYFSNNLISKNNSSFKANASDVQNINSVKSFHNIRNRTELLSVKMLSASSTSLYSDNGNKNYLKSINFLNNNENNGQSKIPNDKCLGFNLLPNKKDRLKTGNTSTIKLKSLDATKKNMLPELSYTPVCKSPFKKSNLNYEVKLKESGEIEKTSQASLNSKLKSPALNPKHSINKKTSTKESFLDVKERKNSECSMSSGKLKVSYNENLDKFQNHSTAIKANEEKPKQKLFMNKQEKAFKQLAAIVIGFTLCFLPYFVVFLIVAMCEECISETVFTATLWLGYLNSTINPFLYAISNKRFFKRKSNLQRQTVFNRTTNVNFY